MEFIHRHQPTTDESPPWAGIIFKLPVDSDALSERLKTAYPDCRTHRERKHRAAIDFLTDELHRMQSKSSADFAASEGRQDEQKAYIDILSDRSRPQSASSCTSPSGPGSIHSPGIMERTRPSPGRSTSSAPLQSSTPTTNPQQFVWSAHDGRSMRPKTKRKMTLEERSAYKETRKRGACDKCRKQKGRCTHVIEGDPLPMMAEQGSKPPKRRGSAGLEISQQEGLKSMKTEHASDVHHPVSEAPNPFQPSLPRQQSLHERRNEPAESAAEATSGHQQWEGGPGAGVLPEEYVFTEPPMDQFAITPSQDHEPWRHYQSRNSADPLMSRYVEGASMNRDTFSPPMANPPAGQFSFESGYYPYVDPWPDNEHQPVGTSGPT